MINELSVLRIGCISASRISDMLSGGKGITRERYAAQLAAERMTGRPHRANVSTSATRHGHEFEPMARMKYELKHMVMVSGTGSEWVPHPFIQNAGCSPDGMVDEDGLTEFKNPETHTFFRYLATGEIPKDYKAQMLWQLACTRRKWCDWVAHDPDMPDEYGYIEVRFEPAASEIADLEREVRFFNAEIEDLILLIKEKRKP